jgi:hypothetical protein
MLMSLNNIDDSTGAPALAGGGGSELRHAWADLCEHEGGAGGICALLHPDIVMTDQPKWKDRPAMLYADWADTSAHTIRSLAVLQSERRKVAIIPRLGPKLTLFAIAWWETRVPYRSSISSNASRSCSAPGRSSI